MEGEQGRTGEEEKRIYGAGGIILYGQGAESCGGNVDKVIRRTPGFLICAPHYRYYPPKYFL